MVGARNSKLVLDGEKASAAAPSVLKKVIAQSADLEMYERRGVYVFAHGSEISDVLPRKDTPEAQVADASFWEFFHLVRFRGGPNPCLQWYSDKERPLEAY